MMIAQKGMYVLTTELQDMKIKHEIEKLLPPEKPKIKWVTGTVTIGGIATGTYSYIVNTAGLSNWDTAGTTSNTITYSNGTT